jgi:23S rRNA (uracil1939-C5)-methyltransferase
VSLFISSCRHRPACPGCPRFGAFDASPDSVAELRRLCERHGARFDVQTGARLRFRNRARLAVRGRTGAAKIGIFAAGSHRVVDIPRCEIHHPLINDVARALKAVMRELGATCYDDSRHSGLVRAIQVAIERTSGTAQVVLVCNDHTPDAALPLLSALGRMLGPRLHSLWWNGNPSVTNRILGDSFELITGPPFVVETVGGAQIFYPPGAFGQNNLEMFDQIVAAIHAAVPEGHDIVELFAGTGGIGLGLVAGSRSVVFNEIGEASLAGLERGLAELEPKDAARARVIRGPAHLAGTAIQEGSIVIADPPRKGLGAELLDVLQAQRPARLHYVSCGLDAFVRDSETLVSQGLRLESATAFDVFPYTDHIETLAAFARNVP